MARALFAFLLLFIAGGFYFIYHQGNGSSSDPVFSEAHTSVANWNMYTAPSGAFRVFFPKLPQNASSTVLDKDTHQLKYFATYASTSPEGAAFMVNIISFKPNEAPDDMKALVTKHVTELVDAKEGNQLLNLSEGEFRNQTAYDFEIVNGTLDVLGKAFVLNQKLYVLTMTTQDMKADPQKFNFFVNSFEPLNPAG